VALLYEGDATGALAVLERTRGAGFEKIDDDLALARFRTGDFAGAVRLLRERLEITPENAVARGLLGEVLVASKKYDAAIQELERAAHAAPALDRVEFDLGQAYGHGGNAALGSYHLARALEMRGELDRAIAQYRKAAKLLPADSVEADAALRRIEALQEVPHRRIGGP
jgi:tetratricopeptide (TPR) repeat protein